MTVQLPRTLTESPRLSRGLAGWSALDELENEAIGIIRETAGEFARPALLFSGGKDSTVLLHLAIKAFAPARMPFPLLHIDTGHNFPEVIAFRDRIVASRGARLVVRSVETSIAEGRVHPTQPNQSRNAFQTVTLLDAIAEFGFDALLGGARRDEEKARAKERVFSFRDAFGAWDPRRQRPELWSICNARVAAGEHMRVFPLSNWTEIDIWSYVAREGLELPALYYTHRRPILRRGGQLVPVSDLIQAQPGEAVETLDVRFRTVGDMTCTLPVPSSAATPEQIIAETLATSISERGATRLDDRASETAMEQRKRAGYF